MSSLKVFLTCLLIIAGYTALTILLLRGADTFDAFTASLCNWELGHIVSDYAINSVQVIQSPPPLDQRTIEIIATNKKELIDSNIKFWPAGSVKSIINISVLRAVIIVLLVPLIWPGLRWADRFVSLLVAIPCFVVAVVLDIPTIALGNLDRFFNHASFVTNVGDMLSRGGDWALFFSTSIFACVLGRRIVRHINREHKTTIGRPPAPKPTPGGDIERKIAEKTKQAQDACQTPQVAWQSGNWAPITSYDLHLVIPEK